MTAIPTAPIPTSPDRLEIRENLLQLASRIREIPAGEYPIGIGLDIAVIAQLGEFGEERALPALERILRFPPEQNNRDVSFTPRRHLDQAAREALESIRARAPVVPPMTLEDRVFGEGSYDIDYLPASGLIGTPGGSEGPAV